MNIPISNIIWLLFLKIIIKDHQLLCWFQIPVCSEVSWASLCSESPLWGHPCEHCFHVQNSQVICFQINLHVGSVMNIPCGVIVFWYLPLPLLKTVAIPFWFPSPGIFLIPVSYQQTFRVPKCLSVNLEFLTLTVTSPILEFNSIYSTHSSEKSLIFRWRWKSNKGAQFSLCHLRTLILPRELGLLFLDLKRFVIFICQRWHASCGILSTLHFHIGFWLWVLTLSRLLLELWTL